MSSELVQRKGNPPSQHVNGKQKGALSVLKEAALATFQEEHKWEQDDLLDAIYWGRQLLAVVLGLIWGLLPLKGFFAFLGFIAIILGGGMVWCNLQQIDEDDFGGSNNLLNEGFAPATALFLLVWVVTYSAAHF